MEHAEHPQTYKVSKCISFTFSFSGFVYQSWKSLPDRNLQMEPSGKLLVMEILRVNTAKGEGDCLILTSHLDCLLTQRHFQNN